MLCKPLFRLATIFSFSISFALVVGCASFAKQHAPPVEIALTSAHTMRFDKDYLGCTLHFKVSGIHRIKLDDPRQHIVLIIEGKEYKPQVNSATSPRVISAENDHYENFYFKIGQSKIDRAGDGFYLKLGKECLNSDSDYLVWFWEGVEQYRVLTPKVQ